MVEPSCPRPRRHRGRPREDGFGGTRELRGHLFGHVADEMDRVRRFGCKHDVSGHIVVREDRATLGKARRYGQLRRRLEQRTA